MVRADAIKDGAQASRHQSRCQRRRTSARRPQMRPEKYEKIRVAFYQ
jgi:hypothetical protein